MSSTSRGAQRLPEDYYVTPHPPIEAFLRRFLDDEPDFHPGLIIDPCAGGNVTTARWTYKKGKDGKPDTILEIPPTPMSYPTVLRKVFPDARIVTNDVRPDSPADSHADFLNTKASGIADLSITNPPFSISLDIVKTALRVVGPDGFVVKLLRLNWLGSDDRKEFVTTNPPYRIYVHSKRMGFFGGAKTISGDELSSKTDSIEYAHMCWRVGYKAPHALLKVI